MPGLLLPTRLALPNMGRRARSQASDTRIPHLERDGLVPFVLRDRVVVVTGAASGIGAALAQNLASKGVHLALIDRDRPGLDAVAEAARRTGGHVRTYVAELSDPAAIRELPQAVHADLGPASVLINNAGITLTGAFEHATAEQFDRVMAINFHAPVAMVRAFLPQLRTCGSAQIANLSSLFGIIGVPGQVAYCASKFALRGFSEALRAELATADIGVSVVHPGGIRTNLLTTADTGAGMDPIDAAARKAGGQKFLRMDPRKAAARIVKGIERRENRILVGADARVLELLQRLMPASYGGLLSRF
jgi:short-subunit dehydrogenase